MTMEMTRPNESEETAPLDRETALEQASIWLGCSSVLAALDPEWGPKCYEARLARKQQEAQGIPTTPEYHELED